MASINGVRWWQKFSLRWRRWKIILEVPTGADVPESVPDKCVVLVKSSERSRWLAFDCPCRTGHRVMLNLDTRRKPTWLITSTKPLTLSPSVDELTPNHHCHYFIKHGRIKWVEYNVLGGDSERRT